MSATIVEPSSDVRLSGQAPRRRRKSAAPLARVPYRGAGKPQLSSWDRDAELLGYVIPAMTAAGGVTTEILGRNRTAYFYKSMAIKFRQGAREAGFWFKGAEETHLSLAKMYLREYRKRMEARGGVS